MDLIVTEITIPLQVDCGQGQQVLAQLILVVVPMGTSTGHRWDSSYQKSCQRRKGAHFSQKRAKFAWYLPRTTRLLIRTERRARRKTVINHAFHDSRTRIFLENGSLLIATESNI